MFKKLDKNIFIFLGGAIVILWQMLKPGYILTLDMIFTPKIKIFFSEGIFYNAFPVKYFLKFLNLFLDGWIIQKIILITLFFLLGYLAFCFLPVSNKYYARYWSALFYAVNPFVYERFLAGHWMHLFAYAFLPPFIYYLIKFSEKINWRNGALIFIWLFIIGLFSLHFLTMATLILLIYIPLLFVYKIIKKDKNKAIELFKIIFICGFVFLIFSSYWIAPHILHKDKSIINTFDSENWEAFKTAGDPRIGTELNVLSLYGFWGERENWAKYFLWPKDNFIFWLLSAILFFSIIIIGIISGLKDKRKRNKTYLFFALLIFSFILSCGIGNTVFKNLNFWLFENIGFWSGFRDTQKFSGLLAFTYACFGGFGFLAIINFLHKINFKFKKQISIVLFLIPVLYTYTMIGGFARQLQPVQYPDSWNEINNILNKDKENFKVLFLPWHLYMSLDFNNNIITANPAKSFFDKEIEHGENMEIGGIFSQSTNKENQEIENIIFNAKISQDTIINLLHEKNIKYIISYDYLTKKDYLKYDFLESSKLKKIIEKDLTLFEIMLY